MATSDLVGARTATALDYAVIEQLAELARAEARPQRGGPMLLDHDFASAAVAELIDEALQGGGGVVVGAIDEVVVGYALIARSGEVAAVRELFVHPEARNVGVAAATLDECLTWASRQGCTVIESQVLPGNRAAKNFFERVGMVTRKMTVSRKL